MRIINFLFIALILSTGTILACSCTPQAYAPACQKISDSSVAFLGERIDDSSYVFRVGKVYKGLPAGTKQVTIVPGVGSCSTDYSSGVQYLMFGSSPGDNVVFSGLCSGSRRAQDSEIQFLDDFIAGKTHTIVYGRVLQFVTNIGYPQEDESSPLENAVVVLEGSTKKYETRSKPDGTFSFVDVLPGQYKLRPLLEPYTPAPESLTFILGSGGCRLVYPQLKAMATVSGKAVGSDGRPIRRERIEMLKKSWLGKWYHTNKMWANTDEEGNFHFDDLESGEYLIGNEIWGAGPGDNTSYPRFYYPGVFELPGATLLAIAPKQQISNIKLTFPAKDAQRNVTITVLGIDGKPPGTNLLQIFSQNGLIQNLEGAKSNGRLQFVAYQQRSYTFKARYWVDNLLGNDRVKVKRLLLAEPVTITPGQTNAEIILYLNRAVTEDEEAFYTY